jgi:hypothetical protein
MNLEQEDPIGQAMRHSTYVQQLALSSRPNEALQCVPKISVSKMFPSVLYLVSYIVLTEYMYPSTSN